MASTATVLGQNVASIVSGSGHLQVQKDFERLPMDDAPLVGLIGYGDGVKYGSDFKHQWIKDRALSTVLTLGGDLTTGTTAVVQDTTGTLSVQVGTLLLVDSEILRVTAVAPTTTTTTVARGESGTTATNHSNGAEVRVLSPAMLDGAVFTESPTMLGEFEYNYPQLIPYEYSMTGLRAGMVNYLTKGGNELDYHTSEMVHMKLATRHLENTLLYGRRQAPSGSTVPGTLGGLFSFITTNATTVSGLLSASHIEDTMDLIFAWDNRRQELAALMKRSTARIFSAIMRQYFSATAEVGRNSVGVEVTQYKSALGTVNVTICESMPANKILLLRLSDLKILPIDLDEFGTGWQSFNRDKTHTNAVSRQKGFYGAFTLKVGDERRHGVISGFTSTVGSYPGAV